MVPCSRWFLVLFFKRHAGLHSFSFVICFLALVDLALSTLLSLVSVGFFDDLDVLPFCVCLRNFTVRVLKSINLSDLLST